MKTWADLPAEKEQIATLAIDFLRDEGDFTPAQWQEIPDCIEACFNTEIDLTDMEDGLDDLVSALTLTLDDDARAMFLTRVACAVIDAAEELGG